VQNSELISGPSNLLMLAAVIGGVGIVLFILANLIMKATGGNINVHARESRRYRDMGPLEQITVFHSNPRNVPVALVMGGIILVIVAICMAVGGAVWYLIPGSSKQTTPREEWFYFAKDMLEYGQANDVTAMVTELSLSELDLGKEVMNKLIKANPDLEYRPPTQSPNQDKINSDYREEVEIFTRSYQDLFSGQLVCVTSPLKDLKGIDSYTVIIWVKKDEKTHGIKIDDVLRTSKGLKVNSWIGSRGYPPTPGAQLHKKRALIEDEECRHPDTIRYEYEYVQ